MGLGGILAWRRFDSWVTVIGLRKIPLIGRMI
jgi:hypothetical protein